MHKMWIKCGWSQINIKMINIKNLTYFLICIKLLFCEYINKCPINAPNNALKKCV